MFSPVQIPLFASAAHPRPTLQPFTTQLLKWIGNKQRFAHEIIAYFPSTYSVYYEPFLGSGAVLGTLNPHRAVASDSMKPLMDIWQTLHSSPETLVAWYQERWQLYHQHHRQAGYELIKANFNAAPNGADLLFLARACYGGVVRFRKDGYMSTPCGIHMPISSEAFAKRAAVWHKRTQGAEFRHADFEKVMSEAQAGDLIYCDPPYHDTQAILYGAQRFSLARLFEVIAECKQRGVYVALSLDGSKKTGKKNLRLPIPAGLFEREALVNCGRSMLRRFQMEGQTLENEVVADRLLLTY